MAYDSSPVFRSPSYWIALASGVIGIAGAAMQERRASGSAARSSVPIPEDTVFWASSKGGKDQIVVFPVAGHPGVYDLAGYTSGSKTLSGWMDLDGIEQTVKLTIRNDRDGGIVYLKKIDRLAIFDDLMEEMLRKAR